MLIAHSSRDLSCRNPFGAVPVDSFVDLRVQADGEGKPIDGVYFGYAYGIDHFHSGRLRMDQEEGATYLLRVRTPGEPSLLFYWFEIESEGTLQFLIRDRDANNGTGRTWGARPDFRTHDRFSQSAFQITVYSDRFSTPDWLKGAVIYQVFPDRFARAAGYDHAKAVSTRDLPERIYHEDWGADVDYRGKPETGYIACDFFGGSLCGIEEKLDHIAWLGANVLYLNPVFEARSNHRYDTADYACVDPLLGTEEDLERLCRAADAKGIRIVLDGVFSHTGADSRYFNRLGRYPETGAYQESMGEGHSPFYSWYTIRKKGAALQYDAWWGFPELPTTNKDDLSFRAFILGEDGIVRRWLRKGVAGWRLDVSDELPDGFLREIRQSAKREKPDAAIIGEVWEDASNKVSYGSYRDFAFGSTHDSVMGYPFRNSLLGWLSARIDTGRLVSDLEGIRENYPLPMFYCVMNLIGSHDVPRALTMLSGKADPGGRDLQATAWLTPDERARGTALVRLAVVFQAVYPGAPSIYYGDETGMEGFRDPFNRRSYPWGGQDEDLVAYFARVFGLRRAYPVLKTGYCEIQAADGEVVFIRRWLRDGKDVFGAMCDGSAEVLAWINRSEVPHEISREGLLIRIEPREAVAYVDGQRVL